MLELPQALYGHIGGSIRRGRPTIGDIDLLIASAEAAPIMDVFVARPDSQLPPGETPETLVVKRGGQVPMGRPAQPEEIANAALFLISDEASYMSGALVDVSGGR